MQNKSRNFVAKHMNSFNKSTIETDKKKEFKRGKQKFKQNLKRDYQVP